MPKLTRDERANRDHWDRDADAYRRRHHAELAGDVRWGPYMPPERDLRVLGDVRGRDVLEVGCGGGQAIVHVKRSLGARRAAGCDVSEEQLRHAREHAQEEGADVEFVGSPATDLSAFADRSFDVVFSAYALGFVADVGRAFAEAARVLRPDGLLAFSWSSPLWQILAWDARKTWVAWSYFDRETHRDEGDRAGPWTEFRHTYGDWFAHLRAAGFEVTDIVEPRPVEKPTTFREAYPLRVAKVVPATTIWKARRR